VTETAVTAPPRALRWRRYLFPAAIAAVLVAVALAGALLAPAGNNTSLDPTSPAPGGSRAVAQLLATHGVQVRRATSLAEADQAVSAASGHATLLVTQPDLVDTLRLTELARSAADLVLVTPGAAALDAALPVGLSILPAGRAASVGRSPGCDDPDAVAAGSTTAAGILYYRTRTQPSGTQPSDSVTGTQVCYSQAGVSDAGLLVVVHRSDGRQITVLGQPAVLTNDALAVDGNAALALRLLGHRSDLVWYQPDPLELGGGGPDLLSLLPPWVGWVSLQLLVTALVAMIWRARRFGPLVREPLPVVVRAAETTEGRARLYRQAGARGWAAATLRTAALRRLARRFEAGPATTPEQLVATVSVASRHDGPALAATLLGPAPGNDAALVRLADEIDSLEQDVRS
jgi:Domain of unknown function (DUF4350)